MEQRTITANGLDFACLDRRTRGRAARPVPPRVPRHGPHLAPPAPRPGGRRLQAVAPFLRGYAPTQFPPTGTTRLGALARDANGAARRPRRRGGRRHRRPRLGGAGHLRRGRPTSPSRWRRAVTAAVPPTASIGMSLFTYAQLQKSWYMFFFLSPLAEMALPLDDYSFIDHLWGDWSPGYDGTWDVARVKEAIGDPERIVAAIGYYRALYDPSLQVAALADEQAASLLPTPKPTLYLHGHDDGCMLLSSIGPRSTSWPRAPSSRSSTSRALPAPRTTRRREPPHPRVPGRRAVVAATALRQVRGAVLSGAGGRGRSRRTTGEPSATSAAPPARPAPRPRATRRRAASTAPRRHRCRSASSSRPLPWRSDPANAALRSVPLGPDRQGSGPVAVRRRRHAHWRRSGHRGAVGPRRCTRGAEVEHRLVELPCDPPAGTRRSPRAGARRAASGAPGDRSGPGPAPRWCRPRRRRPRRRSERRPVPCRARRRATRAGGVLARHAPPCRPTMTHAARCRFSARRL